MLDRSLPHDDSLRLICRRKSSLAEVSPFEILQRKKEMRRSKGWKCSLMSLDVAICLLSSGKHNNALAQSKCVGYSLERYRGIRLAVVACRIVSVASGKEFAKNHSPRCLMHRRMCSSYLTRRPSYLRLYPSLSRLLGPEFQSWW